MKYSEQWLREWVNPPVNREELCATLTMAGLEAESQSPVGLSSEEDTSANDYILDFTITPNRGDCLSIQGLAREVSALFQTPLQSLTINDQVEQLTDYLPITLAHEACTHYIGRIIKGINPAANTPEWIVDRLNKMGIRTIHPVVDVANYVMLELGQPLHAFDLQKIDTHIEVRLAKENESIELLDGSIHPLLKETLVIADKKEPLAIAGIMGGLHSGVTANTEALFLESAYFAPAHIAKQRQHYNLVSDAAYRYERGVDPTLQKIAIQRATQLIIEICGGEVGPLIEKTHTYYEQLLATPAIELNAFQIMEVLGCAIPDKEIETIFNRLQFKWEVNKKEEHSWLIKVPAYRFDLKLAEDLIEEIARLYGYANIVPESLQAIINIAPENEKLVQAKKMRSALVAQGFHEIVSYSFIDPKMQALCDPEHDPKPLLNPISAEMSVMRTNLLPGLIMATQYNLSRQQSNIKLFEIGLCFIAQANELLQTRYLGGMLTGEVVPPQWGVRARTIDFYDLKGYVENLMKLYGYDQLSMEVATHPALHPGQTAKIFQAAKAVGILGALHPELKQKLDLPQNVFVFEINLDVLIEPRKKLYTDISKFPEIRRDIAILINESVPVKQIQDTIINAAGELLREIFIFDVYQGKGIPDKLKSVALGLIFQHQERTLVEEEVTERVNLIIGMLRDEFGAQLRS